MMDLLCLGGQLTDGAKQQGPQQLTSMGPRVPLGFTRFVWGRVFLLQLPDLLFSDLRWCSFAHRCSGTSCLC
jgi:hypothetical protein